MNDRREFFIHLLYSCITFYCFEFIWNSQHLENISIFFGAIFGYLEWGALIVASRAIVVTK